MGLRRLLAALCIVGLLATGIGLTVFFLTHKNAMVAPPRTPAAMLPTEPSLPTPTEFQIAVQVTGQQCPEPSTCTYTYSIQPNYVGRHPLPEGDFTVFYDVLGGIEPQPGTFTVSGGQAKVFKDVVIHGLPGAQLSANVTKVSLVAGPKPVS